ncbi:hypothetical protein C8F01DRAFT_124131 [Mycena amicta]|nr:hypothetical protein C8F01DRAFT_124131 [Mycena amicta]
MRSKLAFLLSASSALLVSALPQGGIGVSVPDVIAECVPVANVSLVWGLTTDTLTTATPVGFSTAPVDADGRVLLATRASIPAHAWNAIGCNVVGKITGRAGGGGGGGGGPVGGGGGPAGGGGGAVTTTTVTFGAIADLSDNICLTVSNVQAGSNMTITHQACIQPLTSVPDVSQAWLWTTSPNLALTTLVFLGASTVVTAGTPTDYVPSLVGTGIGAYVDLVFQQGGFLPSEVNEGLLMSFAPATPTVPP